MPDKETVPHPGKENTVLVSVPVVIKELSCD